MPETPENTAMGVQENIHFRGCTAHGLHEVRDGCPPKWDIAPRDDNSVVIDNDVFMPTPTRNIATIGHGKERVLLFVGGVGLHVHMGMNGHTVFADGRCFDRYDGHAGANMRDSSGNGIRRAYIGVDPKRLLNFCTLFGNGECTANSLTQYWHTAPRLFLARTLATTSLRT
jgi:hypothetical protein